MKHELQTTFCEARVDALPDPLSEITRWACIHKSWAPSDQNLHQALSLEGVAKVVRRRLLPLHATPAPASLNLSDMPDRLIGALQRYLEDLPGYRLDLPQDEQQSDEPAKQHSYVLFEARSRIPNLLATL